MQHPDPSIARATLGALCVLSILGPGVGACDKDKKQTTPAARRAAARPEPRVSAPEASSAREGGTASAREGGTAPAREGGTAPAREGGTAPEAEAPRPTLPRGPSGPRVLSEDQLKALLVAGKYDEAIREARRSLEESERSVPAMAVMAEAYFHRQEYELCRAVLDSINLQQKDHPLYLYLRGRMFLHEGNFALAQSFFEKAVEKNPSLLDAWTVIGVRRLEGGNYQKALEALLRAKALPGGNTYAMNLNLGSCYRGLAHQGGGGEQLLTALNYYLEAERRYPLETGNSHKPYLAAIYNKAILHLDAQVFPGLNNIQRLERGILYLEQYVTQLPRLDPKAWATEQTEVLKILTKAKTVDLPAARAMAQAKAAQPVQPAQPPARPAPPPVRESAPAPPAPPPVEREPPPVRPAPAEREPPPARPAPPVEREPPPARPAPPPVEREPPPERPPEPEEPPPR